MKEKKMKSWVMVRPRKPKEWIIFALMVASLLFTISPVVNIFNKPILFLGLPLMLWMAIGALLVVIIVLTVAYRWGVH
ncbi:MAG: hypothetical protein ACLRQA_03790 [Anaerovoracaceae bacterium]|uniref:hypothetical protein n=1 Tax=Gallibacter sp. Marseille-QA0791 TaxID=3378781 RepID=UPI003A1D1727